MRTLLLSQAAIRVVLYTGRISLETDACIAVILANLSFWILVSKGWEKGLCIISPVLSWSWFEFIHLYVVGMSVSLSKLWSSPCRSYSAVMVSLLLVGGWVFWSICVACILSAMMIMLWEESYYIAWNLSRVYTTMVVAIRPLSSEVSNERLLDIGVGLKPLIVLVSVFQSWRKYECPPHSCWFLKNLE